MGDQYAVRVHPKRVIKPRLNILFPEVDGLREKRIEKEMNRIIAKKVQRMVDELGYRQDSDPEIWGGYQVKLNGSGLLSLRLEQFCQTGAGSIRSPQVVKTLNFDLKTGEPVKLDDLFNDDADYATRINRLILAEIESRKIPLTSVFAGIFKHQNFYLTEEALVVYFQPGEYTPETYGLVEFEIPYPVLAAEIYKNGPLARFLEKKVLIS